MDFKGKIQELYKLSQPDLEKSMQCFIPELIKNKTYFLKQGETSNKVGLLKSGLMRSFVYDDNGDELTTHFFTPGTVVISLESFNNQVPSFENIDTLEDSELLVATYGRMQELFLSVPVWKQIAKDVDVVKYNDLRKRLIRFQTLTASERYQLFCQNYPELIKKVALRHIASYLGIDIATLSRIRKKK